MSLPKNQHIVPEVYLRQFHNGDGAHVYCIDFEDKYKMFPQKRGVGDKRFTKKKFYNDNKLSNPYTVENYFGEKVEQFYPKIIEAVSAEKELSEDIKNKIIEWIYCCSFRSTINRSNYERIAQFSHKMEVGYKKEVLDADFMNTSAKAIAKDMQLSAFIDEELNKELMTLYKDGLLAKTWRIFKAPENNPFWTNDNPGFSPNLDDRLIKERPFHYNPQISERSWVYFVLSPKYCIEFLPTTILKTESGQLIHLNANEAQVNQINFGVLRTHGRYLISNSLESLKKVILIPKN